MSRERPVASSANEGLAKRFLRYQQERFPVLAYLPLTAAFTFCASAFSRHVRGAEFATPPALLAVGSLTALCAFLWLRILDEHKDAEVDRRFRPELPVPRGLITLRELRWIGIAVAGVCVLLNIWLAPILLAPLALLAGWIALMTREFFIGDWLRPRLGAYMLSHMLVMPMIDLYTTGLDWLVAGEGVKPALWLFLAVTYANGCLLEIGRKVREPKDERPGVDTYSGAWGAAGARLAWTASLLGAWALTTWSLLLVANGIVTAVALGVLALAASVSWKSRWGGDLNAADVKRMSAVAPLWILISYLALGNGPWIERTVATMAGR